MRQLCWLATLTILCSGCTSFKTTVMQRCSNGAFGPNVVEKTKGIPVKLKVPTHVEVVLNEDFFIEKTGDGKYQEISLIAVHGKSEHKIRSLSIKTEVIYTPKVFTVDFKRPAGGTFTLGTAEKSGLEFDDEQYFAKIRASYEEKTLADINTAISTLKPSLSNATKKSVTDGNSAMLGTEIREVARARFDISDPCWEDQLHEFVRLHLTACHEGCNYNN